MTNDEIISTTIAGCSDGKPPELLAAAILVDTDGTHAQVTAWFRNLRLEKSKR